MTTYGGVLDSDSVELFRGCLDRIATALETQNRLMAAWLSMYAVSHGGRVIVDSDESEEIYTKARDWKEGETT